jgi:hypothetical protein
VILYRIYIRVKAPYKESRVILNPVEFRKLAPYVNSRIEVTDLKARNHGFLLIILTGFWIFRLSIKKAALSQIMEMRKSGTPSILNY